MSLANLPSICKRYVVHSTIIIYWYNTSHMVGKFASRAPSVSAAIGGAPLPYLVPVVCPRFSGTERGSKLKTLELPRKVRYLTVLYLNC